MSLDMEWAWQILGTGTSTLAGRSSSLDTCFRFLENHSSSHTWARFRFKARPVTTVSVYNKTSLSLLLNMGENVLEIGPHFYPEALCSFCLRWCYVQTRSLILVEICFLMSVLQKTDEFQGYPALKGAQLRAGPLISGIFINTLLVCQLGHSVSAMLGRSAMVTRPRSKRVTGECDISMLEVRGAQHMK